MKIKPKYYPNAEEEIEISKYIEVMLDGTDYDRGSIETIEATGENCSKAIGKLINILREKEILTDQDIHSLVYNI